MVLYKSMAIQRCWLTMTAVFNFQAAIQFFSASAAGMANYYRMQGKDLAAPGLDDGPELREKVDADPDGQQDLQHQPHIVPAGLIQLHTHSVDAVSHLHATNTLTLLQSVWHKVAARPPKQISVFQMLPSSGAQQSMARWLATLLTCTVVYMQRQKAQPKPVLT